MKALVVVPEPTHRHPNLGLAPIDMTAGFPAAADALRRDKAAIAAGALEAASDADAEFKARFDEAGLRHLHHDAEVLIERLAMCVAGNDRRWLAEYAEWVGPIFRRRGVAQSDLAALCEGLRKTVAPRLGHDELARRRDRRLQEERPAGRRFSQAQRPAEVALPRRMTAARRAAAHAANLGRTTDRRQP
jgi:hypothetical protein